MFLLTAVCEIPQGEPKVVALPGDVWIAPGKIVTELGNAGPKENVDEIYA